MLYLGFSGGFNLVHEDPYETISHDAAAVLVERGEVVAAIEEERLNRIKHSNKFPAQSIRFCLESRGARIEDVERLAFYVTEEFCNALISRLYLTRPEMKELFDVRSHFVELLRREFDRDIDPDKIIFVRHHMAHAISAFALSGFERSLVLAIDGYGDHLSGLIGVGKGSALTEIERYPQKKSLGTLYRVVIQFIGYRAFDEYKVMGLAPYGNPATYRDAMRCLYELLPDGSYDLYLNRITGVLLGQVEIRKKGEPFTQQHKDLAASLQEALEEIVMHVLRHHRLATGLRNLCLAGGVAHNCTMNGKVMYSGMFDQVFVQPAAHDAGCALGAALLASHDAGYPTPVKRIKHVYWGADIGGEPEVLEQLERWSGFLKFRKPQNVSREAARLIADGAVLGWVQGRSEFGPRALGNRSIVADPRPADNKERINQMVKKREGYRPFAPSALEEDATDFFDLPGGMKAFPFMIFVVNVREDKRGLLGAVTHVDGTARLQTVARDTNPRYWELIKAFKDITGVPVLLNTSFNNNVEPIVDSVEDSIVSFLTTGLDYLVVGDYLVEKRTPSWEDRLSLGVSFPPYVKLHCTRSFVNPNEMAVCSEVGTSFDSQFRFPISNELCDLLMPLDGEKPVGALLANGKAKGEIEQVLVQELENLWAQRLVKLRPAARSAAVGQDNRR
jgi:carbamoyltransferase